MIMAGSSPRRSYEDFEPYCKWTKEEEKDTFEVHLNGFKKEQLRVQLTNLGTLIITGEREMEQGKWTRFRKVTRVDKDCDTNGVRAKFTGGVLYVSLPKKSSSTLTTPVPPINGMPQLGNNNNTSEEGDKLKGGNQELVTKLSLDKKLVVQVAVFVAVIVLAMLLVYRLMNLG